MADVKRDFEKVLWRDRQARFKKEFPGADEKSMRDEIDGEITPREINEWLDYSWIKYVEPIVQRDVSPTDEFVSQGRLKVEA